MVIFLLLRLAAVSAMITRPRQVLSQRSNFARVGLGPYLVLHDPPLSVVIRAATESAVGRVLDQEMITQLGAPINQADSFTSPISIYQLVVSW